MPLLPVKSQLKKSPSTSQPAIHKIGPLQLSSPDTHCLPSQDEELLPSSPPLLQSLCSNSLSCSLFLGSTGAFHPCSARPHTLLGDHSRDKKLLCSPNLLQALHRASAEHSSPSQLHSCPIFCASLAPTWLKERRQLQPSSLPLHSTGARWIFPKGAGRR